MCFKVKQHTSILGFDGDDALSLRPETLCGLGLNFEFVRHVLFQVRHRQRSRSVPIHLEGAKISCTDIDRVLTRKLKSRACFWLVQLWWLLYRFYHTVCRMKNKVRLVSDLHRAAVHRWPRSPGCLHWVCVVSPSSAAACLDSKLWRSKVLERWECWEWTETLNNSTHTHIYMFKNY